ncbi:MAG: Phosphatidylserine/phosphatidylglycerophosphate/cardiolipin synthase -like [Chthonomonadales bacterium]|nr:Phosphatidylserine/phosphatidylglycerophosphate/cardiolipin synthase -like [Chthonomonadales bacterium]
MELLVQPGTGIKPLLEGIDQAEHTVQIVIFRFDRGEIEAALTRAVRRGVFVHALVAYTSAGQGGEPTLRKLEMRLLSDGVSVARTATDLVRYHDKLMIIDQKTLYMLGFNYTYIDIERSRSFGIITQKEDWVREAVKLFTADATRQQYTPECDTFLVSPGNARQELLKFLQATRRQLCIYDGKLTDPDMIRLLQQKAREGVDIRIIGAIGKRAAGMKVAAPPMRLHAQTIIRDGAQMFLGSQSLRTLELDARREVGILIDDVPIVQRALETFEADWSGVKRVLSTSTAALPELESVSPSSASSPESESPASMLSVKEAVKDAIKTAILEAIEESSDAKLVKEAVKEAAREAVQEVNQQAVT